MRWTRAAIFAIAPLLLAACANTQIVSSWRDPTVSEVQFHRVLAVAMTIRPSRRRAVEDRMVVAIERSGARAVPSYSLIPAADTRNVEAVRSAVLAGGFDGAVTWSTTSVRDETTFVPGPSAGFYSYYDAGWASAYDPGYLRTDRIVRITTKVYQVTRGSDRLIWRGNSRTVDPDSIDDLVDGVADATAASMRSHGMLAARP